MDDQIRILREISLPADVAGSGKTRHQRAGENVTNRIAHLKLAEYDPGQVYVLYFDQDGNELNDLYFESVAEAVRHIEWKFGIDVDVME